MATNKLIAAALAGVLAAVSPLAAMATDEHKAAEKNACKGEANKCKGEEHKAEEKKDEAKKEETKTPEAVPAPAEKH